MKVGWRLRGFEGGLEEISIVAAGLSTTEKQRKMGRRVRCSTACGGFAVTASRQRLSIVETEEQRRRGGARRRGATAQAERWSRVVARRRDGGARLRRRDGRCDERRRRRCARDERRLVAADLRRPPRRREVAALERESVAVRWKVTAATGDGRLTQWRRASEVRR
ncbi:hypothetical protein U1Q18_042067 [Sarracenia purpurea var. burkii]